MCLKMCGGTGSQFQFFFLNHFIMCMYKNENSVCQFDMWSHFPSSVK